MAGLVRAVLTEDASRYWPQYLGGLLTNTNFTLTHFKIGEGGWELASNGAKVPRIPLPSLRRLSAPLIQDLDCIVDPTRPISEQRYPFDSLASFEKALTPGDFTLVEPSSLQVRCLLTTVEFNNDGNGNNPELWEIGVYGPHPTVGGQKLLVAYGTFPLVTKTSSRQDETLVLISFGPEEIE